MHFSQAKMSEGLS